MGIITPKNESFFWVPMQQLVSSSCRIAGAQLNYKPSSKGQLGLQIRPSVQWSRFRRFMGEPCSIELGGTGLQQVTPLFVSRKNQMKTRPCAIQEMFLVEEWMTISV